jgi:hypothetical protein
MKKFSNSLGRLSLVLWLSHGAALAWDYDGHRVVNQIALGALPSTFPEFALTPAARERIAFLSGEPDRWRNTPELALRHFNGPDHYFDVEDLALYQMTPTNVSPFRYVFTAQMGAARAANPAKFPALDPAQNTDRTRELPGYLPWAITEHYAKLKSGFSYLKVFEELGTPEEIINAQQNILYVMGTLGHYVGDAAQPLHTTHNYNGWADENPRGFTTSKGFHAWIDGGYLKKVGLRREQLLAGIAPAKMLWPGDPKAKHDDVFPLMMNYIVEQYRLVEPLYQLDKDGKLSGKDELGQSGQAFLEGQLRKAGQMLGDLWYSAWQQAQPDTYLKSRLMERKLAESGEPKKK